MRYRASNPNQQFTVEAPAEREKGPTWKPLNDRIESESLPTSDRQKSASTSKDTSRKGRQPKKARGDTTSRGTTAEASDAAPPASAPPTPRQTARRSGGAPGADGPTASKKKKKNAHRRAQDLPVQPDLETVDEEVMLNGDPADGADQAASRLSPDEDEDEDQPDIVAQAWIKHAIGAD